MQFTDNHLGGDREKNNKTMKLIDDVLKWENPDVVVLTGDMSVGYNKTAGSYEKLWKEWIEVFRKHEKLYMLAITTGKQI